MNKLILLKDLGQLYPNKNSKHKKRYGIYLCYCGNKFKTQIAKVKNRHTKSCGCYKIKHISELKKTHNKSKEPLYLIWKAIKSRCLNINNISFNNYGGRGVTICDEWKNDFSIFYKWSLDNGYKQGLQIDRINNDGNYESSNCRWTTREVQMANTRKLRVCNKSGIRGVNAKNDKWVARISVNNTRVYLGTFKCRLEGAYAYDKYVKDNNLEHNLNFP